MSSSSAPNQQQRQQGPSRPPQRHRPVHTDGDVSMDVSLTPKKRANEQVDLERPHKHQHQEQRQPHHPQQQQQHAQSANGQSGQQRHEQNQSQRGGGRGGFGGQRGGGRGGHQQQQRPQSAAPQQQQQNNNHNQQQQNGGNQRQQNHNQNRNQQQNRGPRPPRNDDSMEDAVPASAPDSSSSSSSAHHHRPTVESSFKTEEKFSGLNLSAQTARALREDFQYETMSIVQAKTIPVSLSGADIVAKAKTGTGKTLAFLVPLVERVLAKKNTLPQSSAPRPVRSLVISPTRELAQQIEDEASRLGKFHNIRLLCVVGGLPINRDLRALQGGSGLDLLIATPGRLKDLLQNYDGIKESLNQIVFLVLDEADRLLDMGFKPDLDAIFSYLPNVDRRQTLLFSATFPPNVADLTARTLKRQHEVVSCVGDEEDNTHQHVVQESLIVPLEQQYAALYELLSQHKASNPNYKVIVFFTTARVASFSSRLFNQADCPTLELHSRLSQSKRTKTSDQFREGKRLVLFSSDVSARGLDFPGVTLIIQIGLTAADQYVHRLGRTARAGNEGHGIIVLAPFEKKFLTTLIAANLPIKPMSLPAGSILSQLTEGKKATYPATARKGNFSHALDYAFSLVENESSSSRGGEESLKEEAEQAYRAWLGFYNSNLKICGWDKPKLVQVANEWSAMIGLREIPSLEPKTVGKMGLKGVPGLRVAANQQRHGGGGGGGRGGQQGGGRGGFQGGNQRPQSARY